MKDTNMRISLVIPAYNVGPYIADCLASAIVQDWPSYEVIVVDDGSTDETAEYCRAAAELYPDVVKCVRQENRGLYEARKTGVRTAVGDWIMFLDGDDMLHPGAVRRVAKELEVSPVDVLCFKATRDPSFAPDEFTLQFEPQLVALKERGMIAARTLLLTTGAFNGNCSKVFRRQVLETFAGEEKRRRLHEEDKLICLTAFDSAYTVGVLDGCLYYYRPNRQSITATVRPPDVRKDAFLAHESERYALRWGMEDLLDEVWAYWAEDIAHGVGTFLVSDYATGERLGAFEAVRCGPFLDEIAQKADLGACRPFFALGFRLLRAGDYAAFSAWARILEALRITKRDLMRVRAAASYVHWQQMLPRLGSITPSKLATAARLLAVAPVGLACRPLLGDTWLIGERPDQARDNGYVFFKWLCENHPEQRAIYLIDKAAPDYQKVAPLGKVVQHDSWRHLFWFCTSRVHISAHVSVCWPRDGSACHYLKPLLRYRDVFLQHGVNANIPEFCSKGEAKLDLFICATEKEHENVRGNLGYGEEAVCTGLPRFDEWWGAETNGARILLMPSWRRYIERDGSVDFTQTEYYRQYQGLLNSERLNDFLKEKNLRLIFCIHDNMRKFLHLFEVKSPAIEMVGIDDSFDIQELLKTSALMITDYSSVHFDFGYMLKPVVYFQFDKDLFYSKQYRRGNFEVERDGFGPVVTTIDGVIDEVAESYENGFSLAEEYRGRAIRYFQPCDRHNCERVYKAILKRDART